MKQYTYLCMVATVVGCSLGITCAQTSDETLVTLPSASVLNKRLKRAKHNSGFLKGSPSSLRQGKKKLFQRVDILFLLL